MFVPASLVRPGEISKDVAATAKALAPDVVRVRHEIASDWSGDPAIFFRVTLTDRAASEERLAEVTRKVRTRFRDRISFDEMGLLPYFSFRSASEQAELRDESWS